MPVTGAIGEVDLDGRLAMIDKSGGRMRSANAQIKEIRKKKGLNQQDLADLVGVVRSTIANIESENANPSLFLLEKIALAFGMSVALVEEEFWREQ